MRELIRNRIGPAWRSSTASVRHSVGIAVATMVTVVISSAGSLFAQEIGQPNGTDRQISQIVARLMQNDHLSRRELDDEISSRAIDKFIASLDPAKVYFYQSDMDEFNRQREELDNMLEAGQLEFAIGVFERFLTRVDERVATIDELLAGSFDFTLDEELITDADLIEFPATPEEARDRWRKRIKYNLLVFKSEDTDDQEAVEKLTKRYHSFARRMHQFNAQEVIEMFITALTTSYDPHTTYLSSRTYENFLIQMRLNLEGIGASLASEDGVTVVKRIVPGGAADRDGRLGVEDRIVSVGQGTNGEMIDVADMKLDDVVQMVRGDAGTVVRLGVMPGNSNELVTIDIVREKIELKDSEAQATVFEQGTKDDGSPFRIGVIDLPSFYSDMEGARLGVDDYKSTTRDVRRILEGFEADGVDAVVLDLRRNGGGSLSEAINCTGLFIDVGPVVQVKDSYGQVRALYDEEAGTAWDGPLVVMTSKFSASASEILAGAIQDYERGVIVGDVATHGKGTVQSLVNLGSLLFRNIPNPPKSLGALKITMQQFYRPSGDSTQKRGVLADVILPSITTHMDVGEGDLEYPVEFDRVRRAEFETGAMVSEGLIQRLRDASRSRIDNSQEFEEIESDIEKYLEQKERTTVTLNEEEFLARRRELNAEQQEEDVIEDQVNEESTIERDYYMDEVLSITVDYLKAIATGDVASRN